MAWRTVFEINLNFDCIAKVSSFWEMKKAIVGLISTMAFWIRAKGI
jgi:hypothetical protein